MSVHDNTQAFALQRPTMSDREAWKTYWKAQGQYWRMEPEINTQRQMYLEECCAVVADIKQGIYPFKGVDLSRADVEWLVAMYFNEDG